MKIALPREKQKSTGLLKTIRRQNNEMTAETARVIKSELTSQVSRKLVEIKVDLNSQNSQTLDSENC